MPPFVVTKASTRPARTRSPARSTQTLVPQLRKLPGFAGYYLIEAGNGVLSSLGLFETPEQGDESTKVVAKWITDENFSTAIPNAPKITSGKVVAQSNGAHRRVALPSPSSTYSASSRGPGPAGALLAPDSVNSHELRVPGVRTPVSPSPRRVSRRRGPAVLAVPTSRSATDAYAKWLEQQREDGIVPPEADR